jgi:hypothetical protein
VSTAPAAVSPRRVLLTADELELLRRLAGLRTPADFRIVPRPEQAADGSWCDTLGEALASPVNSLRERGLVRTAPAGPGHTGVHSIHPSVRANLAVLAAPEVLVETRVQADVNGRPRVTRSAHAVVGVLGASLVRVDEAAVAELSIFPAERLGAELERLVPPVGRPERSGERPAGLLPLAALEQLGVPGQAGAEVIAEVGAGLRLGAAELSRARALLAQARGVLRSTVLGLPPVAAEPVRFGQVLWFATAGGWVGLAPEPGRGGEAAVRLTPARPEDVDAWLAPLVGEAIR